MVSEECRPSTPLRVTKDGGFVNHKAGYARHGERSRTMTEIGRVPRDPDTKRLVCRHESFRDGCFRTVRKGFLTARKHDRGIP